MGKERARLARQFCILGNLHVLLSVSESLFEGCECMQVDDVLAALTCRGQMALQKHHRSSY